MTRKQFDKLISNTDLALLLNKLWEDGFISSPKVYYDEIYQMIEEILYNNKV